MLATLSSQLHFVRQIQEVDTTGIEPLRSLRDETAEGEREAELGLDALKEALEKEDVRGKFHKRIRRRAEMDEKGEQWDVLGTATKKVGRYFVVEGGKDR
jgi:Asp-tRNA(Asn)/Glu-tRNA(Gln) amidotransferase C subunit